MDQDLKHTLWNAANKLRGSLPASQYKDVVLGLVFLQHGYEVIWKSLADNAQSPDIGRLADQAMDEAMTDNPALGGMLPRHYHRLDPRRLADLVELLDQAATSSHHPDLMGEVYEYFLGSFARAEGRRGGEFFTPPSVVRVIVEVLQPGNGRVYDPCCGTGGMFVQTEQFIKARDGRPGDIAIYGQESVEETWRLARMNLAVHRIDDSGLARGDTFVCDEHAGVQMNYVMANPPFNIKDWARDEQDPRWCFGVPPAKNANFAWIQHILSKLAPNGRAGVVLTNGSMSSNAMGEGEIRTRIVDADLVSCMVALPGQLFRNTGIPVCLWFFDKAKTHRAGQVLFIDARGFGELIDRAERALTGDEINRIGQTFRAWLSGSNAYQDVSGFCRSVLLAEIRAAGYVLNPGRFVGAAARQRDDVPADEKIARLTTELLAALDESDRLDVVVREQLGRVQWQ
ncbi:N-6 DNA methylase [Mycobacterium paragordonae]|uniref:site-specific DNA-methyltransferase (adenine-specific) n=1 Tax=Mycobacterium paragordonae TaxID=1389713 RepID=A0A4R5WYJ3_9MYCO|nr:MULTISPECIES: N-6 DNA methylase [Mycobacterium]MDP7735731.1 N-6 DNA methylase [Mycobacterium paragordonae]OBJ82666.1 restriction endonuclease subunit M [Mycobacterium gordonae]TDL01359.1 SAM-dependent DNA methyltransferase [Mycobacterium paragordonae]TDL10879.1 SAM-dependent DNA methyltransferase [Mycobacterium paragordonae]